MRLHSFASGVHADPDDQVKSRKQQLDLVLCPVHSLSVQLGFSVPAAACHATASWYGRSHLTGLGKPVSSFSTEGGPTERMTAANMVPCSAEVSGLKP